MQWQLAKDKSCGRWREHQGKLSAIWNYCVRRFLTMPTNRKHITAVLEDDSEAKAFIHGKNNASVLPHSPPAIQEARGLASRSPYGALRKISVRIPEDLDDTLSQIS